MAAAEKYLERRSLKVGKSTMVYERRIIRHIVGEIEAMRERGELRTTHPKEMGPVEVRAFLDWMKDPKSHEGKSLDPDTQVRYLARLEGILRMNDNHVIERMKDEGYRLPQKVGRKPIRAITQPDLETVQEASRSVGSSTGEPEGWRRAKARFLTTIYVATGLRPSELRLAFMEDLDVSRWRFYVRSPKGVGVWAETRTVTIMPPYRQDVTLFLEEREKLLRFYSVKKATHLIPNLRNGEDKPYSENHFRELKKEVQEISGINFRLKDFRPTFATMSVEKDPNLLVDVSAQLGHSNLMTTQRYYAQISADSAGSRLEKAWGGKGSVSKTQTKPEQSEALNLILQLLGVTPEELAARLMTKAQETPNPGIDSKNRLTGYN
ncbi:MAG TPA: site-specific integrase [Methanomassiliicoccales archaeon]